MAKNIINRDVAIQCNVCGKFQSVNIKKIISSKFKCRNGNCSLYGLSRNIFKKGGLVYNVKNPLNGEKCNELVARLNGGACKLKNVDNKFMFTFVDKNNSNMSYRGSI